MNVSEKDIVIANDDIDDVVIFELAIAETKIPAVVRHAPNYTLLFKLLEERIPGILFLDVHMPCEDGVSCLMKLRKNKDYDNLPVVMFTANSSRALITECYENGASFYMHKGYTLDSIAGNISKVLNTDWAEHAKTRKIETFVLD